MNSFLHYFPALQSVPEVENIAETYGSAYPFRDCVTSNCHINPLSSVAGRLSESIIAETLARKETVNLL